MKHTRKLALLLTLIMLPQSIALTGCSDNAQTETEGGKTESTDAANAADGETEGETAAEQAAPLNSGLNSSSSFVSKMSPSGADMDLYAPHRGNMPEGLS